MVDPCCGAATLLAVETYESSKQALALPRGMFRKKIARNYLQSESENANIFLAQSEGRFGRFV